MTKQHALRIVTVLILAGSLASGCARMAPDLSGVVRVDLQLRREAYRPGEAVAADVAVTNLSGRAIDARALNFDSLRFVLNPASEPLLALERTPVYSLHESTPTRYMVEETLEPQQPLKRTFVFTELTAHPGEYSLIAAYDPNPPEPPSIVEEKDEAIKPRIAEVWSNAARLNVQGPRAFSRDSNGILLEADAIELAAAEFGAAFASARAELLWDPGYGFRVWWVRLEPSAGAASAAFFIDPYAGAVIGPAPLEPPVAQRASEQERIIRRTPGAP